MRIDLSFSIIVIVSITILCSFIIPEDYLPKRADSPNIIVFLVDDMGWQDTSVPFHSETTPFNRFYRTPNMERLARKGAVFTNAYAASPVCTPTRTSIMTGQNPARTRITNWTLRNDRDAQETGRDDYPLRSPLWDYEGLQPGDVTLAGVLQANGYTTIHAGKAHWGARDTEGSDPLNLGYDVNIAGHAAGAPGSFYGIHNFSRTKRVPGSTQSPWDVPGLEKYHGQDIYLTQATTNETVAAIEDAVASEAPFFLNLAHYAVHTPIMADSQYVDSYEGHHPVEAAYASMVEGIDASLGQVMDALERLGVADETVIIFMSDNGGLSAHSRGTNMLGAGLNSHNMPLRAGKGSAYEGGTRVPMIMSWVRPDPDNIHQQSHSIPPGSRVDTPVISDDFFPTILALADVTLPENHVLDGRSILPLLNSSRWQERAALYWHYPHKWGPTGPGYDPFTSIRMGSWKLIYFWTDQEWELYNLETDLSESIDLMRTQPEKAQELAKAMLQWMDRVGAQPPHYRDTDVPLIMPALP